MPYSLYGSLDPRICTVGMLIYVWSKQEGCKPKLWGDDRLLRSEVVVDGGELSELALLKFEEDEFEDGLDKSV